MTITRNQIALAIELRSTGMIWRNVANEVNVKYGLRITLDQIKSAVWAATR